MSYRPIGLAVHRFDSTQRAATPSTVTLGRRPGTDAYRGVADHPEAEPAPGLFIYRFDAPLFFANAGRLRDELRDTGTGRRVGIDRICLEVDDAVTAEAGDQAQGQEGTETT